MTNEYDQNENSGERMQSFFQEIIDEQSEKATKIITELRRYKLIGSASAIALLASLFDRVDSIYELVLILFPIIGFITCLYFTYQEMLLQSDWRMDVVNILSPMRQKSLDNYEKYKKKDISWSEYIDSMKFNMPEPNKWIFTYRRISIGGLYIGVLMSIIAAAFIGLDSTFNE